MSEDPGKQEWNPSLLCMVPGKNLVTWPHQATKEAGRCDPLPVGSGETASRYLAVSTGTFWEPSAHPNPAPASFSPSAHLS